MKRHSAPPAVHVRVHEQEEVTGDALWFVEDTRETAVPESPDSCDLCSKRQEGSLLPAN